MTEETSGIGSSADAKIEAIESTVRYVLRYRSSRSEVWRWYWKTWLKRLWLLHVLAALVITPVITSVATRSLSVVWSLPNFLIALSLIVIASAAWSQALFKSKERILKVGPDGWVTWVGSVSGARAWSEVAEITEGNGSISIVSSNGNALIVPRRAIPDEMEWRQFLADIQGWQASRKS